MFESYLNISDEVSAALSDKRPILALESTIISHGMPYPQNVETALMLEHEVRQLGCVPATCAIVDGQIKAGLTQDEIEFLGKKGKEILKASRRDIPYIISQKRHGATTVAATMIVAHMSGIPIFATGGIGGVHRGANMTMDISADLQELANTSVAVVCAGAKSILDLKLTLEYLETYGVPVVGYKADYFPAFYSKNSPFKVDFRMDDVAQIAKMIHVKQAFSLKGGILIANPIPDEYDISYDEMELIIKDAIKECDRLQINGKEVTPFLLSAIKEITSGKSLNANIALVKNNVQLGARIAFEFSKISNQATNEKV
ncbi:MAG: pseudouridine-5'-phosphate glycosidase [Saprospiraceae bacterium]|nr:pseudouridine-5'-phosphate glycosidase [Saprospiraceae bacterium]